jgi:hypothetical protein
MAGGGTAGGASAVAAAGAEARAYGNDVSFSFLQTQNHGAAQDADSELANPAMVPQPFFKDAIDSATMEWLRSDDFDDYVGGAPPLVARLRLTIIRSLARLQMLISQQQLQDAPLVHRPWRLRRISRGTMAFR